MGKFTFRATRRGAWIRQAAPARLAQKQTYNLVSERQAAMTRCTLNKAFFMIVFFFIQINLKRHHGGARDPRGGRQHDGKRLVMACGGCAAYCAEQQRFRDKICPCQLKVSQ
ncbi:hypothetical protein [Pseudomonas mandelii]|uniref:hypothetical protein n=1 Tax=Pseudomonas mandelii TaxID=75612 RepID=UPI00224A8FFD|nr:hypothetical protein [Pseudomonas mandelii]MCX2901091.1 hypothetical protein [Pseudomonas mandelii]